MWTYCKDCVWPQVSDCDKAKDRDGCECGLVGEVDFSAFDNPTKYEKIVIARLRADGLEDDEIAKCLREL